MILDERDGPPPGGTAYRHLPRWYKRRAIWIEILGIALFVLFLLAAVYFLASSASAPNN